MRLQSVLMVLLASAAQDGPTFRQLAIEHKGQAGAVSMGCGWTGAPLASVVQAADLAVEATVLSKRTYATPDDRDIYTEYEVAIRQVIFQRTAQAFSKPGPPPPTIFKTRSQLDNIVSPHHEVHRK